MKIREIFIGAVLLAAPASAVYAGFVVDVFEDGPVLNLLDAVDIASDPGNLVGSGTYSVIDFESFGDSSLGHFNVDDPFPGGVHDDFVLRTSGTFQTTTSGTYTMGVNHDDGAILVVDGAPILAWPTLTDNRDTFGTVNLAAGSHSLQLLFFQHGGGATVELFAAPGAHTTFGPQFELVESAVVPAPSTALLLMAGLVPLFVLRRSARRTP